MRGHEIAVDRLKLVLIVVCLVAIPLTFWLNHRDVGSVNNRLTKVESPCLKYGPKSKLCQESFEKALGTLTHPEACAVERKAGTLRAVRELAAGLEVTFTEPCAGARLAQERKRGNERAATGRERAAANPDGSGVGQQGTGGTGKGGSGGAPAPGNPGTTQPSAPHHPTGNPSPSPPPSSSGPGAAPEGGSGSSAPTSTESTAPTEGSGQTGGSPSSTSPSVVESAGSTVGEVVTGAGELLHSTTCGLTGPLLCLKP